MAADEFIGKNSILYYSQKLKLKLAEKVSKEDGKGLSTNDLTDELKQKILNAGDSTFTGDYNDLTNKPTIPTKTSELTNDSTYQSAAQVEAAITGKGYQTAAQVQSAVAAAGHVTREIVEALPTAANAKENVIYLILKPTAEEGNTYDEYMLVSGELEKIGDTRTDLSGYLKASDVTEITNAEIDAIWNTVFPPAISAE